MNDLDLVKAIAKRAVDAASEMGYTHYRQTEVVGALFLCHSKACPLKLTELLNASLGNMAHDVFGILRHYNPVTDTLTDGFYPRYSA